MRNAGINRVLQVKNGAVLWSCHSHQISRSSATPEITQQHAAARFNALAFCIWKGFPSKIVSSTFFACHRIMAVHRPQSSRNPAITAAYGFSENAQTLGDQHIAKTISRRAGTSNGFSQDVIFINSSINSFGLPVSAMPGTKKNARILQANTAITKTRSTRASFCTAVFSTENSSFR